MDVVFWTRRGQEMDCGRMTAGCFPLAGDSVVEQLIWTKPVRRGRSAVWAVAAEGEITTGKSRDEPDTHTVTRWRNFY